MHTHVKTIDCTLSAVEARSLEKRIARLERMVPRTSGYARLREDAGAYLARITGELAGRGVQATAQVLVDPRPAHAIARFAQESHGEMVALATHGRGGATRLLLGSVADKVVRTAPVPVLVLRPRLST